MIEFISSIAQEGARYLESFAALGGNDAFARSAVKVGILGALVTSLVLARRLAWRWIKKKFTCTLQYECQDGTPNEILAFEQTLEKLYELSDNKNGFRVVRNFINKTGGQIKERRLVTAPKGVIYFRYKGFFVRAKYKEENADKILVKKLFIEALFAKKETLLELLPELKKDKARRVYFHETNGWNQFALREVLENSRVIVEEEFFLPSRYKEIMDKHIDAFIFDAEEKLKKGVFNKFNFLLHGPAGTGKTTFAYYVAKRLGKSILVPNISGFPKSTLAAEKTNSIVLLDEGDKYIKDTSNARFSNPGLSEKELQSVNAKTLQSLLQGPLSVNDQVIAITTNDFGVFNSTISRVGRIDLILHVDFYNREDLLEWCHWYYEDAILPSMLSHISSDYRFRPCDLSSYYNLHPRDPEAFIQMLPQAYEEYKKYVAEQEAKNRKEPEKLCQTT